MEKDHIKNPDFPIIRVVFIIASFSLAILDMMLLYRILPNIFTAIEEYQAMLIAFLLATVANFTALTWGWNNGRRLEKRAVNKRSLGEIFFWIAIGAAYAAIRVMDLLNKMEANPEYDVMGDIVQMVILAISYIGTGVLIQSSAREIWDADCVAFRKAKKKFDILHNDIADASADLHESIGILKKYDSNYATLDKQKAEIETAIHKSEEAVMSDIVAVTLKKYPMISPAAANQVKEQVLEEAGIEIRKPSKKANR